MPLSKARNRERMKVIRATCVQPKVSPIAKSFVQPKYNERLARSNRIKYGD